jgi:hypothetical protein
MRVGDLVRFKTSETETEWQVGLLLRYDKFIKIAEILKDDRIYYAPGRLVETKQRGFK